MNFADGCDVQQYSQTCKVMIYSVYSVSSFHIVCLNAIIKHPFKV